MRTTLIIIAAFYVLGAFSAAYDILNKEHPFVLRSEPVTIRVSFWRLVVRTLIGAWMIHLIRTYC